MQKIPSVDRVLNEEMLLRSKVKNKKKKPLPMGTVTERRDIWVWHLLRHEWLIVQRKSVQFRIYAVVEQHISQCFYKCSTVVIVFRTYNGTTCSGSIGIQFEGGVSYFTVCCGVIERMGPSGFCVVLCNVILLHCRSGYGSETEMERSMITQKSYTLAYATQEYVFLLFFKEY